MHANCDLGGTYQLVWSVGAPSGRGARGGKQATPLVELKAPWRKRRSAWRLRSVQELGGRPPNSPRCGLTARLIGAAPGAGSVVRAQLSTGACSPFACASLPGCGLRRWQRFATFRAKRASARKHGAATGGGAETVHMVACAGRPTRAEAHVVRRVRNADRRACRLLCGVPVDPGGCRRACRRQGVLGALGRAQHCALLGAISALPRHLRVVSGGNAGAFRHQGDLRG